MHPRDLKPGESDLLGGWLDRVPGESDQVTDRIVWLIRERLTRVDSHASNAGTLFCDKMSGQLWELTCGTGEPSTGPLRLSLIGLGLAREKYHERGRPE